MMTRRKSLGSRSPGSVTYVELQPAGITTTGDKSAPHAGHSSEDLLGKNIVWLWFFLHVFEYLSIGVQQLNYIDGKAFVQQLYKTDVLFDYKYYLKVKMIFKKLAIWQLFRFLFVECMPYAEALIFLSEKYHIDFFVCNAMGVIYRHGEDATLGSLM